MTTLQQTAQKSASATPHIENENKIIHFIGCGGAGMGPLASIMLERGWIVSGSDLCENKITRTLQASGVKFFLGHDMAHLPEYCGFVVYSSAIKSCNPELEAARQRGLRLLRRGEMLAELASSYRRPVAISGSHGKTTITAMLAHIMSKCCNGCGFMIGGKLNHGPSAAAGDGDIFITEADESDGTHALIKPWLGIIPNIEDDHAWSVGGRDKLFDNFRVFGMQSRKIIYVDFPETRTLFFGHPDAIIIPNSTSAYEHPQFTGFLGLNAALAVAAATELGIEIEAARAALDSFPGVTRRMTIHYETPQMMLLEDYAHHPTELKASLDLLRMRYPHHYLRVFFQPHRYARLERYAEGFAEQLRRADSVFIAPVFAAWVESGNQNHETLASATGQHAIAINGNWQQQAALIMQNIPAGKPLLLAVIGAGDLEQVIPHVTAAMSRLTELKLQDN